MMNSEGFVDIVAGPRRQKQSPRAFAALRRGGQLRDNKTLPIAAEFQ
ncbi:MAG TPA: hypothetical protein VN624_10705 [Rhodanobacter sp.]|nr:hypothetical protein [Rhodanobacter sp.]